MLRIAGRFIPGRFPGRWGAVAVLGAALCAGCSSDNRSSTNQSAVKSIGEVQQSEVDSKKTVDQTVVQLGQLEQGGDLQETFNAYSTSVNTLVSQGDTVKNRDEKMRQKRQEYLARWQAAAENIQNPDIKASLEQRRQKVTADYDKVAGLSQDLNVSYDQFVKDAQEIQQALRIDLTPAGVAALKSSIDKAQDEGKALSQKIDAFNAALGELQGKLSPPPPPPPPSAPAANQ